MRDNFKKIFLFVVFSAFLAVVALPGEAMAETKIAVVNTQKVMVESKAAKSVQVQLETLRKGYQEEFSKHERELSDEAKKLSDSRAGMDAEAFAKKKQAFDAKVLETQKLAKKRQQALEEAAGQALADIRDEVIKIVTDVSQKEQYDLVLTRQNIILAKDSMDITDKIMTNLDKSLKDVKLKIKTDK